MQAAKDRDGLDVCRGGEDHVAERLASRDLSRSALSQPLMRTRFDEVTDVLYQDALQVLLAENEDVVEALSPDGAEEALADGVHERSLHGGADHLRLAGLGHRVELRP